MGLIPPPPGDDEDRNRQSAGGPAADPFRSIDAETVRVVIPDDLTGLEAEIRAVQAELGIALPPPVPAPPRSRVRRLLDVLTGRARRRSAFARDERGWPPPAGLARSLLVGPVLAIILLAVAGLVALLPATTPAAPRVVGPPRLATPASPVGTVGGLLPDVELTSATASTGGAPGTARARELRPAVLMLVPDGCACPDLVHQLVGQVTEFPGIGAALVGGGDPAVAQLAAAREGGHGSAAAWTDRSGTLARTYHGGPPGTAPTVLFVAPDGVLTQPPLVFTDGTRIEASLVPLSRLQGTTTRS